MANRNFQLTTSQGGRQELTIEKLGEFIFQLTTSQGGRQNGEIIAGHTRYLSTHDLTRRSTMLRVWKTSGQCFFQLTTSQGGRPFAIVSSPYLVSFNSRPHKEVDLTLAQIVVDEYRLSTHDLTRRSTKWATYMEQENHLSTHDLTRRSTPWCGQNLEGGESFNSRPHKEVDRLSGSRLINARSFNSRPHKEVDPRSG